MKRKSDLASWNFERNWHRRPNAVLPPPAVMRGRDTVPEPLERLEQMDRMRQFREALSPFWAWRQSRR